MSIVAPGARNEVNKETRQGFLALFCAAAQVRLSSGLPWLWFTLYLPNTNEDSTDIASSVTNPQ